MYGLSRNVSSMLVLKWTFQVLRILNVEIVEADFIHLNSENLKPIEIADLTA